MHIVLSLLFDLLWMVVGFTGLRWISRAFKATPRQSNMLALAMVVSFTAGALWPFSDRTLLASSGAGVGPGGLAERQTTDPSAAAGTTDVSAICRGVRSVAVTSRSVLGALDAIGSIVANHTVIKPSGFSMSRGGVLAVNGWAGDATSKSPAHAACLLIDGNIQTGASAVIGMSRPDVAATLQSSALAASGYMITFETRALSVGSHRIGIAVVTASGATALPQQAAFTLQ